jgi:hypothetical protein
VNRWPERAEVSAMKLFAWLHSAIGYVTPENEKNENEKNGKTKKDRHD